MSDYVIYHNPRCSKSREALALLQDRGLEPAVRLYLDAIPDRSELQRLLRLLGISARDLLRKNESAYRELGLADPALDEKALIGAMIAQPKLIERPIVVRGDKAIIGRPPAQVLTLLEP